MKSDTGVFSALLCPVGARQRAAEPTGAGTGSEDGRAGETG